MTLLVTSWLVILSVPYILCVIRSCFVPDCYMSGLVTYLVTCLVIWHTSVMRLSRWLTGVYQAQSLLHGMSLSCVLSCVRHFTVIRSSPVCWLLWLLSINNGLCDLLVLGSRLGSLEFQIGSIESEKIIIGYLKSEKIGPLESEKSGAYRSIPGT